MGAGQSGDQLAVAVISHVVQAGSPELIAMRKHLADSAKRNSDPKFVTRKQFHAAEVAVTIDMSDREIFDRLFTLFDKDNIGALEQTDIQMAFRAINQTAAAMGDPVFSLDQLAELVETVFESVDEDLLEGNANKARIKYTGAISEFVNHPITESYLSQGG